jgi:hypothetical protein
VNLLASLLVWQGLFVGVENTAPVRTPLIQPAMSSSATALVGIGRFSVRAVYIQPLQRGGYGPALQVGISTRVF